MFGNGAAVQFPANFSAAYQNVSYSKVFSAIAAPVGATLTWSVASGSLPTGLNLATVSNTGVISGTPSGSGASSFTLKWTTGGPNPISATSTIVSITVNTLSTVTVTPTGQSISINTTLQMAAACSWTPAPGANPPCPVVWSGSGSPAGSFSAINSVGLLTAGGTAGTATATATLNTVVGSANVTVSNSSPNPVITNNATLPGGDIYQPYSTQFAVTCPGCTPPYSWSITSGAPTGCSTCITSSSGLMSFTPTASGTFSSFIVQVSDSASHSTSKTFSLTVASLNSPLVLTPASPSIPQGSSQQMTATGTYSDSNMFNVTNLILGSGSTLTFGTPTILGTAGTATSVNLTGLSGTAGQFLLFVCESNTSSISFQAPTDSASQVWTQVTGSPLNTFSSSLGMWYFPNSAAITNVQCNASASTGLMTAALIPINGAATSSPIDGTPGTSTAPTTAVTSLASGAITTTNPNDAIIYVVKAAPQTSWTPVAPFTVPGASSGTRFGIAETVTSSTQSGLTTTLSWPGTSLAGGIIIAVKAATSSTGWTESDITGSNVASVNSSGLVQALNVGTATIQGCVNAICGSTTVTVTAAGDTTLTITPSPGSGTVGGTVQFKATGNNSGTDYTAPPTVWGAQ